MMGVGDQSVEITENGWGRWYERWSWLLISVVAVVMVAAGSAGAVNAWYNPQLLVPFSPDDTPGPSSVAPTTQPTIGSSSAVPSPLLTPTPMAAPTVKSLPVSSGTPVGQTFVVPADHYTLTLPPGWVSNANSGPDIVFFRPEDSFLNPIEVVVDHNDLSTYINTQQYRQAGSSVVRDTTIEVGGQPAEQLVLSGSSTAQVVRIVYSGASYTITLYDNQYNDQFLAILNQWRFY